MFHNSPRALAPLLLALAGVLVAVMAVPPEAWSASLQGWARVIREIGPYVLAALAGIVLGGLLVRPHKQRDGVRGIASDDYCKEFRRCLASREFTVIKIFGYTGEVVINDLLQYADRYDRTVEVRMLHRNWAIEAKDELSHNRRPEVAGRRPWQKAESIRALGSTPWKHSLRRYILYYSHQPILKGSIFVASGSEHRVAFFGFLYWDPLPEDGGSQFKSVPGGMLAVDSNNGPFSRDVIRRIESQFEYEWRHGKRAEEIEAQPGGQLTASAPPEHSAPESAGE